MSNEMKTYFPSGETFEGTEYSPALLGEIDLRGPVHCLLESLFSLVAAF